MKKVLLFCSVILMGLISRAQLTGACAIQDILVQNAHVVSFTATTCTVQFDVAFTIDANHGNKYIYIQSFIESQYPDNFGCVNGTNTGAAKAPKAANLTNAFINIALLNNGGVVTEGTEYYPDPTVPLTSINNVSSFLLASGLTRVTLTGVTTTLPVPCGSGVTIMTDVFSTNAAKGDPIQCVNCGIRTPTGIIRVTGLATCNALTFTLTNTSPTSQTFNYAVYGDVDGDHLLSPTSIGGPDNLIYGPNAITLAAGASTTITVPLTGSNVGMGTIVWLDITGAQRSQFFPGAECAPLPVTFKSFNANRKNANSVSLNWTTATEQNNRGFQVQRNDGTGWKSVGFVSSNAVNGSSAAELSYEYLDANAEKGITQYRIQQVDLDGRSGFSTIKAIRGEGLSSRLLVYPNPSATGIINVVFENNTGVRDVYVSDATGRLVNTFKSISNNILVIENLKKGFYTLRVTNKNTATTTVEKVVVK